MPTSLTNSAGVIATPNANATPEQVSSGRASLTSQGFSPVSSAPAVNTTVNASQVGGGVTPLTIPPTTPSISTTPTVAHPAGTTLDANGTATIPPPPTATETPAKSTFQTIMDKIGAAGDTLATKGTVETGLQNDQNLAGKTMQATQDYNNYNAAKTALAQKLESMHAQAGGTVGGNQHAISVAEREGNANLANLAVQAQASQGLLSAAQKTIQDKLDAQFKPVQDQIDYLTKFAQLNQNDLSESEKFKLQTQIDQKKTDSKSVQDAASSIHDSLLKNQAPTTAYSAVDKITQAFADGKLSASEAQSQMYAAAGKYTLQSQTSSYTPGANPLVDSHISNVLAGNETMAQVPANLRNSVSLGLSQQPMGAYSPIAQSRLTMASSRITNQFTNMAAYQLTANGQVYLDRINAALQTPGSVSDQDLLDSLTKLNTGGNAITDAQVKLVTDGKSLSDIANTYGNKLANGGVLSDNQRNQISTIAKAIFENYKKSYQPIYDQAAKQLTAAGIPKAFWTIPDLNNLSAQANSGTNGGTPKGAQSDSQYVESTLSSQGIKYTDITSKTPAGQKAVIDNSTGQIGFIPSNEFNASVYTPI